MASPCKWRLRNQQDVVMAGCRDGQHHDPGESLGGRWTLRCRKGNRTSREGNRTSREDSQAGPALGYEPVGSAWRSLHLWYTLVGTPSLVRSRVWWNLYLMEMVFRWPFFSQRDSATEPPSSPTQWTRFPRRRNGSGSGASAHRAAQSCRLRRPEAARGRPSLQLGRKPTMVLETEHRVGDSGLKPYAHRSREAFRKAPLEGEGGQPQRSDSFKNEATDLRRCSSGPSSVNI